MKCKASFVNIFAAFLFGITAVGFGVQGMNSAVKHHDLEENVFNCLPQKSVAEPGEMFLQSTLNRPNSQFTACLFQIMFILFIISPPLIVLMLFLIWQELKKRNELK